MICAARIALAMALTFISMVVPANAAKPAVLGVFANGDFVPHVPSVADVKAQLGELRRVQAGQDDYYVYRIGHQCWLVLYASEAASDEFAGIEQVLFTELSPAPWGTDMPIGKQLVSDRLDGIALGTDVGQLASKMGMSEPRPSSLFGKQVDIYEFAPLQGQDDLRHRFFVLDGKVVAFSVVATE